MLLEDILESIEGFERYEWAGGGRLWSHGGSWLGSGLTKQWSLLKVVDFRVANGVVKLLVMIVGWCFLLGDGED